MRQLMMFNRVSADGYFATDDGQLDWAVPDDAIDQAGAARLHEVDTMLFGRRTYDAFESFWPTAVKASPTAEDPHSAGRHSSALRAMGEWINATQKLVFSKTRTAVSWQNSQLFPELDPRQIQALKAGPGRGMIVFGSGSLVSQLTEHGLIDEYQFVVGPLFLGGGKSLISGLSQRVKLELVEAKPYPSGNVVLRYARRR
jgi:dihydrofolate reductase